MTKKKKEKSSGGDHEFQSHDLEIGSFFLDFSSDKVANIWWNCSLMKPRQFFPKKTSSHLPSGTRREPFLRASKQKKKFGTMIKLNEKDNWTKS